MRKAKKRGADNGADERTDDTIDVADDAKSQRRPGRPPKSANRVVDTTQRDATSHTAAADEIVDRDAERYDADATNVARVVAQQGGRSDKLLDDVTALGGASQASGAGKSPKRRRVVKSQKDVGDCRAAGVAAVAAAALAQVNHVCWLLMKNFRYE